MSLPLRESISVVRAQNESVLRTFATSSLSSRSVCERLWAVTSFVWIYVSCMNLIRILRCDPPIQPTFDNGRQWRPPSQ